MDAAHRSLAVISPIPYATAASLGIACVVVVVVLARARPGRWTRRAARAIGLLLVADALSDVVALIVRGDFSARTSLPLALCNMAVIVAAVACWWQVPLLVEITYFWGLTGTLQAVITPDLNVGFPHLVFFQYLVGHVAIVAAALFLVVGVRLSPRPGAAARVLGITAVYTAFVGLVDALSGADYMFLRAPPRNWTLLRLLGPWPWYVVSAAGVAAVLFLLLDVPFAARRRADLSRRTPLAEPSGAAPDARRGP